MKKQLLLLSMATLFSIATLMAQDGRQRLTAEERTSQAIEKLAPLNLDEPAKAKATVIFKDFFDAQEKALMEMRQSGTMDREAMKVKRDELAKERDTKLKAIFSEEQMKKWSEEIEPTLRPQRGQRG